MTDKYAAQKKYLESKKQLRVWMTAEKYNSFKAAAERNNQSIYELINAYVDQYLSDNAGD